MGSSRRFLVDASFGRASESISKSRRSTTGRSAISGSPHSSLRLGFYEAGNRSNNWQVQAKATTILSGYGEHQVRYGFDYEH
jgi:hypothetical protein